METLRMLLRAFSPRKMCASCLSKLAGEPLVTADATLDAMIRDEAARVAIAECRNCAHRDRVYSIA